MSSAIPEVLPITLPGVTAAVVIPTRIISSQLIRRKREIRLPDALLKRSISREVLAAAVRAILIELLPEEHVIRRGFVEGAEAALDARQKAKASKEVTIPKNTPTKRTNAKTKLERGPRPGQSGAPQPDKSRSVRVEAPSFDSGPFNLISSEEDRLGQKAVASVIERLKAWREANSLSQSQAVKLLNEAGLPVKVRTLQGWEIGRQPQAVTAAGLERFLDQQSNHPSTPA